MSSIRYMVACTLTYFVVIVATVVNAETFESKFQGYWGSSNWTYEFRDDGTFRETEMYHFGTRINEGKYELCGDTIGITLESIGNISRSNHIVYLLEKDFLVDLGTGYDFKKITESIVANYASQSRDKNRADPDPKSLGR